MTEFADFWVYISGVQWFV